MRTSAVQSQHPEKATEVRVERERATWDGVMLRSAYHDRLVAERDRLADAARDGAWDTVFSLLGEERGWVNHCRVGGATWYTPLHQAAWRGAEPEVVHRMVALGAWRTLRTAHGERAIDVARRKGHLRLIEPLTPVIRHPLPGSGLAAIQHHFHRLIHERVGDDPRRESTENLVAVNRLRLPELEPLTEQEALSCWFPVPGMYGGFGYRLEGAGLVVESWWSASATASCPASACSTSAG